MQTVMHSHPLWRARVCVCLSNSVDAAMMLKKYDGKGINICFLRQAIGPMLKHLLMSQASGPSSKQDGHNDECLEDASAGTYTCSHILSLHAGTLKSE